MFVLNLLLFIYRSVSMLVIQDTSNTLLCGFNCFIYHHFHSQYLLLSFIIQYYLFYFNLLSLMHFHILMDLYVYLLYLNFYYSILVNLLLDLILLNHNTFDVIN